MQSCGNLFFFCFKVNELINFIFYFITLFGTWSSQTIKKDLNLPCNKLRHIKFQRPNFYILKKKHNHTQSNKAAKEREGKKKLGTKRIRGVTIVVLNRNWLFLNQISFNGRLSFRHETKPRILTVSETDLAKFGRCCETRAICLNP